MKLSRSHRMLTALVALFGMLFMQWAVASYACPGLQAGGDGDAAPAVQTDMPPMPGCDWQQPPDTAQPALCHAHCHDGEASLDKAEAPAVFPAAVIVSTFLVMPGPLVAGALPGTEPLSFLHRATAPPISIRHCCLRL